MHGFILGGMTIGGTFSIVSIYVLVALSNLLITGIHISSSPSLWEPTIV